MVKDANKQKQRLLGRAKIKIEKKYPELTAEDFKHLEGQEESMLRMIEYKLRMSKEKMKEIIASI